MGKKLVLIIVQGLASIIDYFSRYCDGIGLTEPTGLCDPGFYCIEEAYTSAPPDGPTGGPCPAGGYCPAGSALASPCDPGFYTNSRGAKTKYDCIACAPGKFCAGRCRLSLICAVPFILPTS